MLDVFKARLKAKSTAAGANLSQKRIDAIADRLNKKFPEITDEAEHDTKIDDLYDANDLKEFAKVDDYNRTKEAREKQEREKQQPEKKVDEPKSEIDELKELVKGLATTVQTLHQERQTQTMQQKLAAHEKLKGIDAKLYNKWQLPKSDEEIESFVDEVASTYGHLVTKQEPSEQNIFIPGQQRQAGTSKGKVDTDLIAFAKSKNEQVKTKV
jgi:hypothetical protein